MLYVRFILKKGINMDIFKDIGYIYVIVRLRKIICVWKIVSES